MSTPKNIYVGKRYVPKQCGLWSNTNSYESLSVVLWQGNSYTSKQDVPNGIDIGNVKYWVRSADYNAQVAIYEQNVRDYHQYVIDQIVIINADNEEFKTEQEESFLNYKNLLETNNEENFNTYKTSLDEQMLAHLNTLNNYSIRLKDIAYNLKDYPRLTLETKDSPRLQRALDDIPNGSVLFIDSDVIVSTTVNISKSVKILGSITNRPKVSGDTSIRNAFATNVDNLNICFLGIEFVGGVTDGGDTYSRDRAYTNSYEVAFDIRNAKEVIIEGCSFKYIKDIPIYVYGCKIVKFIHNIADYCFDFGFVNNDHVLVAFNNITRSGDNGFSVSRLNRNCIITNNRIDNSYYSGIFCAGFSTEEGSIRVIITNNVILNSNKHGIEMIAGTSNYIVANNYIDGVTRKSENGTISFRCGIGISVGNHVNRVAQFININNNTLLNCARGGILCSAPKNFKINDNLIIDFGSELDHLNVAVTDFDSNSQPQNFGVAITSDSSNGDVYNNKLKNTRSNLGIVKFPIFINELSSYVNVKDNDIKGMRTTFGNIGLNSFYGTNKNLNAPKFSMLKSPNFTKGNGYSNWSNGTLTYEDNVVTINAPLDNEAGATCQVINSYYYKNKLKFEIEFSCDTSLDSAGILIDWKKTDGSQDRHLIKLSDYIVNFTAGTVYSISDEITTSVTKDIFNGYQIIVIGNFTALNSVRPLKNLKVYNFNVM